jgi:hypothetical protein
LGSDIQTALASCTAVVSSTLSATSLADDSSMRIVCARLVTVKAFVSR